MTDEVVKLILDLASSSKDVSDLVARLGELKSKTHDVADTYQVLAGEMGTYEVAERAAVSTTQQYTPALDAQVQKAVEATQAQKLLRQALENMDEAQKKAGGSSKEMSMRILNLGRAAQDLAQGGFAGILNNIEGIVGGGGLAAGVVTGLGTAALLATPYIKEWVKSINGAGEKIPPTANEMDRFTDSIKANKKAIEELKEKEELTYFELLKYKDLVAETTKLEEEQNTKREAYAVKAGSDKKSRERASAVRETIAEKYESSEELIRQIMNTEHGEQIGQKRVEEILAGAQKGNGLDLQSLQNVFPQFKDAYAGFSPEGRAAAEKKKKDDALVDMLNAQGQEADREQSSLQGKFSKQDADAKKQAAQEQFRNFVKQGQSHRRLEQGKAREMTDFQRRQSAQQTQQQARGIQLEASANGFNLSFKQALQILNQQRAKEAELQKLEAQFYAMVLQTTAALDSKLAMLKQATGNSTRQYSRTAQSNGMP